MRSESCKNILAANRSDKVALSKWEAYNGEILFWGRLLRWEFLLSLSHRSHLQLDTSPDFSTQNSLTFNWCFPQNKFFPNSTYKGNI